MSALARAHQHPDVAAVNPKVHLALLAALVVLLSWPDTTFVQGLSGGFPAVGYCHPCGVWTAKPGSLCTLEEALQEGLFDAHQLLPKLRENLDSQVALEAGDKDEELGLILSPEVRDGRSFWGSRAHFVSSADLSSPSLLAKSGVLTMH